jgi:hypothetical protein
MKLKSTHFVFILVFFLYATSIVSSPASEYRATQGVLGVRGD